MPRTATAPPTDKRMWRRLLSRVHPDHGGNHELFVWAMGLREHVAGDAIEDVRTPYEKRQPPPHPTAGERVLYDHSLGAPGRFEAATREAVMFAESGAVGEPYASLLRLLSDCCEPYAGALYRQQCRGGTYRQIALIAHLAGMTSAERTRWYRICESIPLSQRHAGHILNRLQERAA